MATQLSRSARLAQADDILDNSGRARRSRRRSPSCDRRYRALGNRRDLACERSCRMTDVIRYEHPLNERIRTLMRLEDLFARVRHFAAQEAAPDHHAALVCLFEITDVAARADLKADLVQELERQKQVLAPLRSNPNIEQEALEGLLADTEYDRLATARSAGQGRNAPARQRMADGHQAAHGDSRAAYPSSTSPPITTG